MKALSIILFLTLACTEVYCQQQINPSSSDLKNKIAAIDAYINQVDKDPNLYPVATPVPDGIYSNIVYYNRKAPYNKAKIVRIAQNITTTYIRDNKIVYISQLSSLHDNYSTIKNTYFENDSTIYSSNELLEEHILQVQCVYIPPRHGGNGYTLTIDKNSISFLGAQKIESKNSPPNWDRLTGLINLSDFDKIPVGKSRTDLDGSDMSYNITTDKRSHFIINLPFNDTPEMIKLGEFFKQINLLIPPQK